jgi:hypothetical protein
MRRNVLEMIQFWEEFNAEYNMNKDWLQAKKTFLDDQTLEKLYYGWESGGGPNNPAFKGYEQVIELALQQIGTLFDEHLLQRTRSKGFPI